MSAEAATRDAPVGGVDERHRARACGPGRGRPRARSAAAVCVGSVPGTRVVFFVAVSGKPRFSFAWLGGASSAGCDGIVGAHLAAAAGHDERGEDDESDAAGRPAGRSIGGTLAGGGARKRHRRAPRPALARVPPRSAEYDDRDAPTPRGPRGARCRLCSADAARALPRPTRRCCAATRRCSCSTRASPGRRSPSSRSCAARAARAPARRRRASTATPSRDGGRTVAAVLVLLSRQPAGPRDRAHRPPRGRLGDAPGRPRPRDEPPGGRDVRAALLAPGLRAGEVQRAGAGARSPTSRTPRTRPTPARRRTTARGRIPTTRRAATARACARP